MPFMSTLGSLAVGVYESSSFVLVLAGGMNVDLRTLALSQGWDGGSRFTTIITDNVGSTSTAQPALTVDGIPAGVDITINPGVFIAGCGAAEVAGTNNGNPGGDALKVTCPVAITNYGVIGGGGGSGAVSGGAGAGLSSGALIDATSWPATLTTGGKAKNSGLAGGAIGQPGLNGTAVADSQVGGGGGGLGGKGGDGVWGTSRYRDSDTAPADTAKIYSYSNYTGGAAGRAVVGNANVTWKTAGSTYGALA